MGFSPNKQVSLVWLAALGVVFGDIGTSPLYAYQTAVNLTGAAQAVPVASLIIWTVILVVSVKYAFILMREDYKGQGGVFALFALHKAACSPRPVGFGIIAVVVFGAALLLADGTLTPAISVLSAVEGIVTIHPTLMAYAPATAVVILILLFGIQRFGTGRLGSVFGPVMLLWFLCIALMGAAQIAVHPTALRALDPLLGMVLLAQSGWHGFAIMGAVALAVTGAEALYADLANFGKAPILRAWYGIALPSLLLNYLGQAAYLEMNSSASSNSALFFLLCPTAIRVPLVVLATLATVIASQALISAVFTLVRQAKSLDILPPFSSRHTNSKVREQIFIPAINLMLGLTCVLLIVIFRTGSSLASAYGVAVTGAMAVTSILWGIVMFSSPQSPHWKTFLILGAMLTLDLGLFTSCMTKFLSGGFIPFFFAFGIVSLMISWYRGRKVINEVLKKEFISPEELGRHLQAGNLPQVPGTRVYITREKTPEHSVASILEFQRRTKSVAENIVILMLPSNWSNPYEVIGDPSIKRHEGGIWEVTVPHGYMVEADAVGSLRAAAEASGGAFNFDPEDTFYIFPKEFLASDGGLLQWQRKIFAFLVRNVGFTVNFLGIPPERLIVYLLFVQAKQLPPSPRHQIA
ncbi:MAG: KUP/HAK/KT family potassium transporter [Verrucomicrobia bacterium]|nr:KUP/HAK/KT family potassium transporter [Verrucomicrobiota bacterium]